MECEKCGYTMKRLKFKDDVKAKLTCPDCGWRKTNPKDYPNVNRILVILGKNGPGHSSKPYAFPVQCPSDVLATVESEISQYPTNEELELRLYGPEGFGGPIWAGPYTILDQFANWVFDSGEWATWERYKLYDEAPIQFKP